MIIVKVHLSNFRNFKDKSFEFVPQTNVIVGPNASGKTNIIEALFLLSSGKSFRARIEEEMISYQRDIARVRGIVVEEIDKERRGNNLEIVLTRGEIKLGEAPEKVAKTTRKRLLINGIAKRLIDFSGTFKTVLFGPWDLAMVTESPNLRRRFLDTVLSQADREYRRAILSYEKGLKQRNRLLFRIREEGISRGQLLFWDKLLIKNGDYISAKREEFIEFANQQKSIDRHTFFLEYEKNAISEARLEQYAQEEIAAATTLVGPHRDDFVFKIKIQNSKFKILRDLSRYGSRGEQRIAVLWLKLAELSFIEAKTGEKPTLLLDDIFSELDHEHREIVFGVSKTQQTIITTAEPHYLEKFKDMAIIKIK